MQLFYIPTDAVTEAELAALTSTLPPFRAATAARCRRTEGRVQAILGFCLVRYAVHAVAPAEDTESWCIAPNGKPYLASGHVHFSLTHTSHLIAVAVDTTAPVGFDAEVVGPHASTLAQRVCSSAECAQIAADPDPNDALIRFWCAKEAAVKRTGTGFTVDPRTIPLDGVCTSTFTVNGIPHRLALSPAESFPPLSPVSAKELLAVAAKQTQKRA